LAANHEDSQWVQKLRTVRSKEKCTVESVGKTPGSHAKDKVSYLTLKSPN